MEVMTTQRITTYEYVGYSKNDLFLFHNDLRTQYYKRMRIDRVSKLIIKALIKKDSEQIKALCKKLKN